MSMPNSGMVIHTLVLISDRFSLHCNSIQSTVSIVHLRVILTYLIPLLRVYINQHSSNAIQSNFVQQCIQISTRINILQCTYVHPLFVLHCVYPATFSNGLLTNNSTTSTYPVKIIRIPLLLQHGSTTGICWTPQAA